MVKETKSQIKKSKFVDDKINNHFSALEKHFSKTDLLRESLIKISRQIVKLSKLVIFSIQSMDNDKADVLIKDMLAKHSEMKKIVKNSNYINDANFNIAEQELAEALLFKSLVVKNKLLTSEELNIKSENYVLALSDVTGELLRFAVIQTTNKNYQFVFELRSLVNDIYYLMLKLNLRGGEFRRKFDAVKYVIKRLDEICYDISKMQNDHNHN